MLRNYFNIAIRSLLNNKVYSFINVAGLSIGIAASMLILLYVVHEFSYDKFHVQGERIYRIIGKVNYGGQLVQMNAMSLQFGPLLKEKNADVENYVRLREPGRVLMKSDEEHNNFENAVAFADTSLFSVFTFPLVQGNYHSLSRPSTVILTAEMAKKYFGTIDAVGKTITYNKNYPLEVVGIMKSFPSNSTLRFNFVISFSTLGLMPEERNEYLHATASLGSYPTYILVSNPEAVSKIETSTRNFVKSSVDETYFLEKFSDTHLGNNMGDASNITYLYLFFGVGFIILLLALINYMNLTTARATLRGKEIGIRKVIGARQSNLSFQFYFESTLMTLLAFGFALIWIELALPLFLNTLQIEIDPSFLTSAWFVSVVGSLLIVCILLAGSYPSVILSRFVPSEVLKGKSSRSGGGALVRKGFTIFQFAVSIALVLVTLGIHHQLDFLRNQKIGLNKEQVMVVNLDAENASSYPALKNDLKSHSGIRQVAAASIPLYTYGHSLVFTKTPGTHEDVVINVMTVDEDFFSTLEIEWVQKPDSITTGGLIINEAALEKLKITKEDIGIKLLGSPITGIVKNFNYESLRQKVYGLVFTITSDTLTAPAKEGVSLYIRLDSKTNVANKIDAIKTLFRKYQKTRPFEYYFLDDAFAQLYKSEDRLSNIFYAFTCIAMLLACLGLVGLITFATEVRTKEIGIRKVLGASVRNILFLLSKDFIALVLVGVAIAIPFAGWYTQLWLNQFSYRVEIPWWFSLLVAASALIISLLITSVQGIKAAMTNPTESLRSE